MTTETHMNLTLLWDFLATDILAHLKLYHDSLDPKKSLENDFCQNQGLKIFS